MGQDSGPSLVSEGHAQPCGPSLCKDRLAELQGARASGPSKPCLPGSGLRAGAGAGAGAARQGPLPSGQVLPVLGPGTAVLSPFTGAAAHCIYVKVFMGSRATRSLPASCPTKP